MSAGPVTPEQRRAAWADIQRLGPDAERVVRDVVAVFGRLGGLPVVTKRASE